MRINLSHVFGAIVLGVVAFLVIMPATVRAQAGPERIEVKRGNSWYPATVLKREGTRIQVHYEGLSDDFNEWVGPDRVREAAVSAVKPTVPAPEVPKAGPKPAKRQAEPADEGSKSEEGDREASTGGPGLKITSANRGGAKEIKPDLDSAPETWSMKADVPGGTATKLAGQAITLYSDPERPGQVSRSFWEHLEEPLFAGPGAPRAIVAHVGNPPGQQGFAHRLEVLDLAAGRSMRLVEMPVNTKPIDFSPDGTQVLLRNEEFGDQRNVRIDVFSIGGPRAQQVASWKPYDGGDVFTRGVEWGQFLDNTHVLTLNGRGTLVLWELPDVRAVYVMELKDHASPVLSPSRKYLVTTLERSLCAFEAMTGNLLASGDIESAFAPKLCFRPDGKQLAVVSGGHVRVWDFETGKMLHDVMLQPGVNAWELGWVADDYILLNGHYLLDLPHRVALWEYKNGPGAGRGTVYGGRYWYMPQGLGRSHALASAVLPDAPAKKAAAGMNAAELLAVKPGVSVSMEVNIEYPQDVREKVVKALEAKLKANKLTISDGQPIKLMVTTAPGEKRHIDYQQFGRPGSTPMDLTEVNLRIAFEMDGKAIWEATRVTGAPMSLSLKKDQTIEQAIAELKAEAWHFFEEVNIPREIARVPENLVYGTSYLTLRGVQAQQADGEEPQRGGRPGRSRR